MKKKSKNEEQEQPISGVEFYEDLVENPGKAPEIYYNAHDRSKVEIPPKESRLIIRSRRVPGLKKWYGKIQIPVEE